MAAQNVPAAFTLKSDTVATATPVQIRPRQYLRGSSTSMLYRYWESDEEVRVKHYTGFLHNEQSSTLRFAPILASLTFCNTTTMGVVSTFMSW